ncbi:MAG: hypothetical protein KY439_09590 [Actinobacteria bacterium]|nr:hypothetical protein [Actinomycetota bacterium]
MPSAGPSLRLFALAVTVVALVAGGVRPAAAAPGDIYTVADATAAEDGGTITFTVTRTNPTGLFPATTLTFSTADGTATSPGDYTGTTTGTVTFAEGATTATATVALVADATAEPDETFTLTVSPDALATCADCTATGTIQNDENILSIADVTVVEGDAGTVAAEFPVSLTPAAAHPVTVEVETADESAKAPDDYEAQPRATLTFPVGTTTANVVVAVKADTVDEVDETFLVKLSNSSNAAISDPQASGTIEDDDPKPVLTVSDVRLVEGSIGPKAANFTVALSPAWPQQVTVRYATVDATATASDYTPTSGTLTFAPGDASKRVTVTVNGDTNPEPEETFVLRLSEPTVATIGKADGIGTIVDDDGFTPGGDQGYTLVGGDGGIFNFGSSRFHGSTGGLKLNQPVIGMAHTPGGGGYWLVAKDGGIFSYGDAEFFGSTGAMKLNAPVLGMEATPSGKGYFLFAADGGIFTFGDARFNGSTGAMKLNAPVVGMATTGTGNGYWLVAQDGGVFTFGDATFHGSTGDRKLNQPVFDMAPATGDGGYWLVAKDGGVFTFGATADFHGSAVGRIAEAAIGIGATPTLKGYWIADSRGGVFAFGDARNLGDRRGATNNAPIVGFAVVYPRR